MSGVITKHGQYEHCCHCGAFVLIQDLEIGYSPKWPEWDTVDLCPRCYLSNLRGWPEWDTNQ